MPLIVVLLALIALSCSAAAEKEPAHPIRSCPSESRKPPISLQGVAAAIAEDAFRTFTNGKIATYRIYLVQHASDKWVLMIQEWVPGATELVPRGHWLVNIERSSAEVRIVPGV
jgi:hypothetical protein